MSKQVIINSSPLIFLSKANHLELLKVAGDIFLVPDPVISEIQQRGADDVTVKALQRADWIQPISIIPHPLIQSWDLGIGETGVLSYALNKTTVKAVIDDGLARKCAETFSIPVLGTLGIVLKAKNLGLIAQARPILLELKQHGMYLKDSTLNQALALVGE